MIHSAVSNVAGGGLRLAQEISPVVDEMKQESSSPSTPRICVSLAMVQIPGAAVVFFQKTTQSLLHDGNSRLSVIKHTYVKIPLVAMYLIANSVQPMVRDLVRFANALDALYQFQYLQTKAAFTRRIAVANACFPIPTATTAFLASTNSEHYQVVDKNKEQRICQLGSIDSRDT
jgi:hypothetical protein